MGGNQSGALNAKGFQSAVLAGRLPSAQHITYAGMFNEPYYRVGNRSNKLLELYAGHSVCYSPIKSEAVKATHFIGLFLKSERDGQPRTRPLHAVMVLDISGSMGCTINTKPGQTKTRLDLAREAIKMFFKKLSANDVFSLVTFSNKAETLVPSTLVSDLDEAALFSIIDRKFEMGGTVLNSGFVEAQKNFQIFSTSDNHEKRIIMLTDVCDNSVEQEEKFIENLGKSSIHCTIVGISDDFKSETCQKLVKIRGFNYFCATENTDLQKYLVDNFDYTFFPLAYNIQIQLNTQNLLTFDIFGTPDSKEVHSYGNPAIKNKTNFVLTKMESAFPSDLTVDKDGFHVTQGGLILLRYQQKELTSSFKGELVMTYETLSGQKVEERQNLDFVWEAEVNHSNDTMIVATQTFFYTDEMRRLLSEMNIKELELTEKIKNRYIQELNSLAVECPEGKKEELGKIVEIVSKTETKEAKLEREVKEAKQAQQAQEAQKMKQQVK